MWFSSRLRNGKRCHGVEHRRARAAFKPRLEALEDRCVPSTLTVTNSDDDVNEKGTLRYDVANASSGDTILITAALQGAPIVLTHGELLLSQDVTIKSVPNHPTTISGDGNSRVFEVAANAHVTLEGLNITDGNGVADNPDGTSSSDGSGGGILNFGTLTATGCTISGNSSQFDGGGITSGSFVFAPPNPPQFIGSLTVSNCTISGNQCQGGGGAIEDFGPTLTITNSCFAGNTAGYGGAIDTEDSDGTLSVTGSTFVNNQGPNNGGALSLINATTLTNCAFIDNSGGEGGAIGNFFNSLTVTNCVFSGNVASFGMGGAIDGEVFGTNQLTISNSIFNNNRANSFGGALAIFGLASPLTVSNCIVVGNSAGGDGGAIYTRLLRGSTLTLSDSILFGNSAGIDGGAIFNSIGAMTVSNSIVAGNTAVDGGGIYNAAAGTVTVEDSSSITGNTASDLGADVYNLGVLYLDNTSKIGILYGNPAIPI